MIRELAIGVGGRGGYVWPDDCTKDDWYLEGEEGKERNEVAEEKKRSASVQRPELRI